MAKRVRRLSDEAAAVLQLFVDRPGRARFGLEIIKYSGIPSGSLYPILRRLEERDLLLSSWEPLEIAVAQGRRPRRLYHLNGSQSGTARALLRQWGQAHDARRRTGAVPSRRKTVAA